MSETTPFVGPHGSFWVVCEECEGMGFFDDPQRIEDDPFPETEECWRCHGNGGYWDCVDDLCAALIDDDNEAW